MAKTIIYLFLILAALVFAFPFLWVLTATFQPESDIGRSLPSASRLTLDNYRLVVGQIPVGRALGNSLFVAFSVTILVIFFGSIVGYALSRLNFAGRRLLLGLLLLTMIIPFQITMIPLYILMIKLGWVDSYLALITPAMMSPLAILLFRQFFLNIPDELLQAARIDGCGDLRILFRIVWPLSVPVIITVGLLAFLGSWNDVLWPIIVIREQSLMTLPQLVTLYVTGGRADLLGTKLTSAVMLAAPVILAYAFFQRYFIQSLATTGLKS